MTETSPSRYLVSLDVSSSRSSLEDLSTAIGASPGNGSHTRGDTKLRGQTWRRSVWRLPSEAGEAASLREHCTWLRSRAETLGLLTPGRIPDGAQGSLNIGVMAETITCTVDLAAEELLPFVVAGYGVEIAFYPVNE